MSASPDRSRVQNATPVAINGINRSASRSPLQTISPTAALHLGSPVISPAKDGHKISVSQSSHASKEEPAVLAETRRKREEHVISRENGVVESEEVTEETEVAEVVQAVEGDVEMNGDEDDGDDGDGDEEDEEGEEGSGSEDEEEEEEEEEEDDDDESDGDESEDLEGSPEIIAIDGPGGPPRLSLPPTIKAEPGSPGPTSEAPGADVIGSEGAAPAATAEGETNILIPTKKKRVRPRSPEEEDLPPPPPPVKTIRLERAMGPDNETLEWNILEDAREKGMVEAWGVGVSAEEVAKEAAAGELAESMQAGVADASMEVDENGAGPSTAPQPVFGLGLGTSFADEDPEEIARRLEEKYGDENKKKKVAIKRKKVEYDLDDPFIDDSDILIDAPTHFARPKKEGYFVHAGPLELLEESPVKAKPRTQKAKARTSIAAPVAKPRRSLSSALTSRRRVSTGAKGSQVEPISIDDSDGEGGGAGPSRLADDASGSLSPPPDDQSKPDMETLPIDRVTFKNASRDPRYLPPFPSFPAEVRSRIMELRAKALEQDWTTTNKGKFPEHLRPALQHAGEAAYQHGMFGLSDREGVDKAFLLSLPSVLPYNEFTLKKLVTKLCYLGYFQWMQDCEEEGLRQFRQMIAKDEKEVIEKHEASHKAWEEEVKEWDEKHPNVNGAGATDVADGEAMHVDVDNAPLGIHHTPSNTPKPNDTRPIEPVSRFIWTPDMREVFGQLLDNLADMVDLIKKSQDWSIPGAKAGKEWSEQAMKIRLYKKINDSFPEGYMNTTIISREMTKLTRVKKRQQADQDGE
ncbi:hypothetical protein CI109_104895 [Kwoniella shandongensis]|uniref:Uncharacterized protein n=1 Tax=Kwoniella shandongensis TaxID=1734106 RepID=A0A5M6BQN6_9TREE|nr:uncharacterized protein CI109_006614 [Kwoniella shandongensis]KAA5525063.1 hypothetical protein CI109_006614 [Kwoniella shandongensis]